MRRNVALVTAIAARDLDEDLPPLERALREAGALPHITCWDDATVDWARFDLAVLRSTWDYASRLGEFLDWAERVAASTTLLNPPSVVRWNTDKHYLATLAAADVPIVPSEFIEPHDDVELGLAGFLGRHAAAEFVVKPAVGAGSRDTQRYARTELAQAADHARRLVGADRSAVLQPYLDAVDLQGETALIFFRGLFSHAIRKGPLLRRGEGPTDALFATEEIAARAPSNDERRVAIRALAALPFPVPLYARVDLIRDFAGQPRVLELEMTEPSLFFAHAGYAAASRFAAAILERIGPK